MGKVYLVGAGPGAPDLLTLRAARLIESADVVFHDALVHPDTLKLAARARFVDVGKRYGKVSTEQRFINRSLVEAARTHGVVVRLKGGDPMLFGRAQEEIEALAEAGVECEVVPGVTAALAAAASLKASLTRRGVARTVAFLTPRVGRDETASEWLLAAMGADSVVLYMAAGASQTIAASLIAAGKPRATPVALVESATLPEERRLFTTLSALAAQALPRAEGPVVMCVGDVFRESVDAARFRNYPVAVDSLGRIGGDNPRADSTAARNDNDITPPSTPVVALRRQLPSAAAPVRSPARTRRK